MPDIELMIHPTCMLVFQDLPATDKLEIINEKPEAPRFFSRAAWLAILCAGGLATLVVVLSYTLRCCRHEINRSEN